MPWGLSRGKRTPAEQGLSVFGTDRLAAQAGPSSSADTWVCPRPLSFSKKLGLQLSWPGTSPGVSQAAESY